MRRFFLLLPGLLAALLASDPVSAHEGGEPLVLVPVDHVLPGQPFPLTGADVGDDAVVTFELRQDELVAALGRITAGPDGHFETTLALPATFPDGYAELVASSSDGSTASTWILVGERTESTPPPPDQTGSGIGRTAIALAVVLGLAAAALALASVRFSRRKPDGRP